MFVFVLLWITLCPLKICYHLEEEEKAGCFAVIILHTCCCCGCYVDLPRGDVGWCAVCDCGIS